MTPNSEYKLLRSLTKNKLGIRANHARYILSVAKGVISNRRALQTEFSMDNILRQKDIKECKQILRSM